MLSVPSADAVANLPTSTSAPSLISYYDDATGEHTALTATQVGQWVARTSAMLRHGHGLRPGDRVVALLPPHWQTAVALLGAWATGLNVSYRPWATAGLPRPADEAPRPEAVFVSRSRLDSWLEEVPAAGHRFVLALGANSTVPDGYVDFITEAAKYPDTTPDLSVAAGDRPAVPGGTSFDEWGGTAKAIATELGFGPHDRIMVDVAGHEQALTWLLAPLSVGASVVICANSDPVQRAARMTTESITRVL